MNYSTQNKNPGAFHDTAKDMTPEDWDAIADIHDRARLDELSASVGVEAFLSLAATFENEGLFEGEVWVACDHETVVEFIAFR